MTRIPDILKESTVAMVAEGADAITSGHDISSHGADIGMSAGPEEVDGAYPWHHPFKQILRADYEVR
jgi:hypothetical protein